MAKRHAKLLVLHVEDDDNDACLFAKACERAGLAAEVHRVAGGEEAKAYLLGEGEYADRSAHPLPQILVLDLRLPQMDGFTFLRWLRAEQRFAALPVLIFTASLLRDDQTRALAEGATSYFVKPSSFETLVEMVQSFRAPGGGQLN